MVIVQVTFDVAGAILTASPLSLLGLGAQPPTAEWGAMLSAARPFLRRRPMLSIAPGMAIMITELITNLVGDALRDALDPACVHCVHSYMDKGENRWYNRAHPGTPGET